MRQMRKAFFVEKGQPPEAAPGGADYSSSRRSSSTRASARGAVENFIARVWLIWLYLSKKNARGLHWA